MTENDPLGAFELTEEETTQGNVNSLQENLPQSTSQHPIPTDEPILFRSSVQRSATFEGSPPAQNKIHRSETVPAASVASSLASLGSSIKINFRYAITLMYVCVSV